MNIFSDRGYSLHSFSSWADCYRCEYLCYCCFVFLLFSFFLSEIKKKNTQNKNGKFGCTLKRFPSIHHFQTVLVLFLLFFILIVMNKIREIEAAISRDLSNLAVISGYNHLKSILWNLFLFYYLLSVFLSLFLSLNFSHARVRISSGTMYTSRIHTHAHKHQRYDDVYCVES